MYACVDCAVIIDYFTGNNYTNRSVKAAKVKYIHTKVTTLW